MIVKIMCGLGTDYMMFSGIKSVSVLSKKKDIENFVSSHGGSFLVSNEGDVEYKDARPEAFRKLIVVHSENGGGVKLYEFYTRAYICNDIGKTIEVIN